MSRKVVIVVGAVALIGAALGIPRLLQPSEEQRRAFYNALRDGEVTKLQELLRENRRLATRGLKADTPPLCAATGIYSPIPNRNRVVRLLLENGADPNEQGPRALRGCIFSADVECIQILLEAGADPLLKDEKDGKTALDDARYRDVKGVPETIEAHLAKKS